MTTELPFFSWFFFLSFIVGLAFISNEADISHGAGDVFLKFFISLRKAFSVNAYSSVPRRPFVPFLVLANCCSFFG